MDNRPDIWHHLRDHETPPPGELQQRIEGLLDDIHVRAGVLKKLQDEQQTPPAGLRAATLSAVKGQSRRTVWKSYAGIAAVLLLVVSGLAIYKTLVSGRVVSRTRNTIIAKATLPGRPRPVQPVDSLRSTGGQKDTAVAVVRHSYRQSWTLRLDGHSIRMIDNDPLYTFTSYRYPELSAYMQENTAEELRINIDQYTNIVVSRQAAAMIREMFQTKSNGKPTRRARKTRERIEDWRKADQRRFGAGSSFNPTDPVDLAEFIFK